MRGNTIQLLTMAVLCSLAMAACGPGCLKCNTENDACLLCDFASGYALDGQSGCSQQAKDKCQVLSTSGDCLQCAPGYYYDGALDACDKVPAATAISKCEYYADVYNCQQCSDGYYLLENVCMPTQYSISGCSAYAADNLCAECDIGTVLHPSRNRCVSVPSDNCLFQNNLRCDSCASGFALDYNHFVGSLFGGESLDVDSAFSFVVDASVKSRSYSALNTPCRPLSIDNCQEYESFVVCKRCFDNYFLSKDKTSCEAFPHPAIPNCAKYTYYNSCSECNQGYLLAGTSDCLPVLPIDNCASYSTTSAANLCMECKTGYYVSGNACIVRLHSIANCNTYSADQDNCDICASSFVLTSDSRACLPQVPNCVTYQASTMLMTTLKCQLCADTFAYNSTTSGCDAGGVSNCSKYANNAPTTCLVCSEGYYLDTNTCKPHKMVTKCTSYSPTVANECTKCDNTSFLNTQDIGCVAITQSIAKCAEYSSPTACAVCEERFYISGNTCQPIAASEHCLAKNALAQCVKCESGYLLKTGACSLPLALQTAQCDQIQDDGLASNFVCDKCSKNTVPFNYKNTYVCQLNSVLGNSTIANCVKYTLTNLVYNCVSCVAGYFVSDANTCVSNITNSSTKALVLNYSENKTNLGSNYMRVDASFDYFMTVPVALQNCKYVVYTNTFQQQCLNCKSGSIASVNIGNNKSHIDPNATNPATFTPALGYGFNTYSCKTVATPVYYPGATNTVPSNCESFSVVGSNVYCKACRKGYTGKVDVANGQNFQYCNLSILDCNASATFGGLIFDSSSTNVPTDMMVYLSCHACFSPNKIPVVFAQSSGDIAPFGLAVSNNTPMLETIKNDSTVQCLDITPASFKYKAEQAIAQPVDNCGVAKYNIDAPKLFATYDSYSQAPIVCAACKPGFAPVRTDSHIIVRCDPIDYCDMNSSAQWFNSCGSCQIGYAWYFDLATHTIDFSRCVPTGDQNCLATAPSNYNLSVANANLPNSSCAMCAPGYSFNLDGVCEVINVPLCNTGAFVKSNYVYHTSTQNFDVLNLFNNNNNGCQQCQTGYVAVRNNVDLFACTPSNYVIQADFPEDTVYVSNCKHYSTQGSSIICRECQEGYITSTNGKFCANQDVYPDCESVNANGNRCKVCQSGYVQVNGYCEKPAIQQCDIYDSNLNFQSCLSCIDGFKLVNNKCVKGHVDNCKLYDDNETCLSCFDSYLLVAIANNNQACLPINEDLNCEQMDTTEFNTNQNISCTKCANGFAPSNNNSLFSDYVCQNTIPVENCELYDVEGVPANSSLNCMQCKNGYYLRDNACVARFVIINNCSTYSMVDDFCELCSDGYYLSNEGECVTFPTGIFGCVSYSNASTCLSCDKQMYLSGSTCNYVTQSISKCAYYKTNTTCALCEFNYYLLDNVCVRAEALNCATYSRIDRCASCPEGFGMQQSADTGVVDCVFIDNLNCRVSENIFPFFCEECTALFYNDSGRCMAVEQAVDNCDMYDSPVTCARCDPSFVLSLDGKHCLSGDEAGIEPYPQCVDNKLTLRPQCNVCGIGQRFVKGVCTACTNNSKENGCMFCDGDLDASCLVCIPGYYMDKNGKCSLDSSAPSALMDSVSRR